MAASNAFTWYETTLPSHERKRRGHFSTPPQLIEKILDACGYTAEKDLAHLRVLDPACGSGNFLISATRRLMAFGKRTSLDEDALATLVQHNIWGFDPDPVACFLAEMQLQMAFTQQITIHSSVSALPVSPPYEGHIAAQQHKLRSPHIHQADGLAFAWEECENVDLFLANPPYLASKNTDLSGYVPARQRGQADSYLLFLRLALQIVRPNGWIGLILPDALLARASASSERELLLSQTTVHHLWHLSNVFAAYVGAVVIIAQKCCASSSHFLHWERGPWRPSEIQKGKKKASLATRKEEPFFDLLSHKSKQTVSQALLRSQPRAELRYLLSEVHETLVAHLHACHYQIWQSHQPSPLASLGMFVVIRRGEEISKDSSLLHKLPTVPYLEQSGDRPYYPVLRGGVDVRSYTLAAAQYSIIHEAIKKPVERYLAPKILVVKSVARLQAALDMHGHIVLQTLYMLRLRPDRPLLGNATGTPDEISNNCSNEDDLYFLLALLNSRLLQQYVYVLHTAYKWVQPQIEQYVLMHLPIPIVATAIQRAQIVQRARLLMGACDKLGSGVELKVQSEVYEEQEQAICSLYTAALEAKLPSLPI
jgi:hypothetical protein